MSAANAVAGPDMGPRPAVNPAAFPRDEYASRVARARTAMERVGLDALLVTEDRNVFWLTGFGGVTPRDDKARPAFALVTRDGQVSALVSHARGIPFRESSWVEDVQTYESLGADVYVDAAARLVEAAGPGVRTLGMELGHEQRLGITVADLAALRARLAPRRAVDASAVLWRLRGVKSPAEQARLERACRIADAAFAAVFPALRPGMTDREIAGRLQAEMARQGASSSWVTIMTNEYERGGFYTRDRVVEAGDLVWVDMGANVLGYYSDYCRAVVLGRPSARQVDTQAAIHDITMQAMAAVRPGVAIADVARVCEREMARHGFPFNTWGVRYGHGIGLVVTEPPHVAPYDETVVEAGMTLTLEPGTVTPEGRFQIEENFVVTETGARCLSQAPREILVVPR